MPQINKLKNKNIVTNLGFSNFLTEYNYEPYLANINCEALIIFGKNDWINDSSLASLMVKKIPNSILILLDECGHSIWRDQKEKFFAVLRGFFSLHIDNENISP